MLEKKDPYAALRHRDFRLYLVTRILLSLALQIQVVIIGWHVYSITKDPLSLGLIGLVEIIPNFSVTLFAGHFADLYNRKKIVITCLSVLMFSGIALYSVTHMVPDDHQKISFFYIIIACTGFARGILSPSMFSILTETIPKKDYVSSATWNSTLWQISVMIGAGSSGFLFAAFSYDSYLIMSVLVFFGIIVFSFISPKPHLIINDKKAPIFASIKGGFKYVFNNQVFLGALSLDLFAVLFGGAVALLPIYAQDILMVGPQGLGFLKAAPSFGSFAMSIVNVYWPPVKNTGRKLLWAVFGFGVCMIIFGISVNFYLSIFILAISGACDNISVVIRSTIMHTLIPPEMKGKVFAVNSMFIGSSNEIGEFESGVAAKIMGVVPAVVFGGTMTLFVVLITWFKAPKLKNLYFDEM